MKVLFIPIILTLLVLCVQFGQTKNETHSQSSKSDTPSQSSKNETHSKSSMNDTESRPSKKNDQYSKLLKNETQENLTISLDYELIPIVGSAQGAPVRSAPIKTAPLKSSFGSCAQKDIDAMKKKSAFLAKRFNDKELGVVCQRQHNWNDVLASSHKAQARSGGAPGAAFGPPGPQFTQNQRNFIDEVRSCRGKQCYESGSRQAGPLSIALGGARKIETNATSANYTAGAPGGSVHAAPIKSESEKGYTAKAMRKEYRTLTDDERNAFHAALNALKTTEIDGVSKYNLLVEYHAPATSPSAHFGCSFLPWHREFLKQLEVALRWEDPNVFLPYWDSTLDKGLPNPCDSVFFSDAFMGPGNGKVNKGAFSTWKTARSFDGSNDLSLTRGCGGGGDLIDPSDIDYAMTRDTLKDLCYCNDPALETAHGMVHVFVGGHMSAIPLSPNDPIFFMHHCFIDYIWEQWRLKRQNRDERENDYPTNTEVCGEDFYADVPMKPFPNLVIKDGLSNTYTDELFEYALRPECPDNCYGPYLFCSKKFSPPRCLSKIKLGGNCKGFEDDDCCDSGKCVYGTCKSN